MIVLLNGAFGIGKTTVARDVVRRMPRAMLFDPEWIGIPLQRVARLFGRSVDDFQDLRSWRRLTVFGLRIARWFRPNIVVPMAFSNAAYLQEIRDGARSFDEHVTHFCLVAPLDVVRARLRRRGATEANAPWEYRRASECCAAHGSREFAQQISAEARNPAEIAGEVLRALGPA
ncbi:MAG TPA: AAA family ATPase [Thermoanaerobaculia bacterium]|nr:AAA family ATPase [Thermoanaerobaculia bacterium]